MYLLLRSVRILTHSIEEIRRTKFFWERFQRTLSQLRVEIKGRVSGTPCVHGTQIGVLCEGIVGRGWNRLIWNSAPYSRRSSHERAWRLLSRGRENTAGRRDGGREARNLGVREEEKGWGEWMHIITFFPGAKPIATSVAPKWRYDFPAVENVFTRPRNNNVEKKVSREFIDVIRVTRAWSTSVTGRRGNLE